MPRIMPSTFADVVFPHQLHQSYTYRIPDNWEALKVGDWVLAPFGHKVRPGFVINISTTPSDPSLPDHRIRLLDHHFPSPPTFHIDPIFIDLVQWMADYYLAPIGICFSLIQPPLPPFRIVSRYRLTMLGQKALERGRLSAWSTTILTALKQHSKGLTLQTLKKLAAGVPINMAQLKRQKWVEEAYSYPIASPLLRLSKGASPGSQDSKPKRERERRQRIEPLAPPPWWNDFLHCLHKNEFAEFFTDARGDQFLTLLRQSIRKTSSQHRRVLVIFPDMKQATAWAATLRETLDTEIGIYHSGLPEPVRIKEWVAIRSGQYQVVVGTRLAVLAPLSSVGLIIVCHEEDPSYKEEQRPYYHAREVARARARLTNAILVLHSPHPSLETVYHFSSTSGHKILPSERLTMNPPSIVLVDQHHIPYGTLLSKEMKEGIEQALSLKGGIVIFHNRKGFSPSIVCGDCGMGVQCETCQVHYQLRSSPPLLSCPYCGQKAEVPTICTACSGSRLEPTGYGTERIEHELRQEFPHAIIGRMDRNTVRTDTAAQILLDQFRRGLIHVLICTEMVFHVGPLSPVRFVGIPYADAGLHLPDFRSAERLYHHLQSAVALITDGITPSAMVIQTRLPTHHVMQAVVTQRPSLFYEHELAFRQAVGYPPYLHLIHMTVTGNDRFLTQQAAQEWVQALATHIAHDSHRDISPSHNGFSILGPLSSHTRRRRLMYRETILFKTQDLQKIGPSIRRTYDTLASNKSYKGLKFGMNVDPMDVL